VIVKGNSYTEYVGQAASFLQHKQARAMAGTFVWIPTSQVVPTGAFKNGRPCVHFPPTPNRRAAQRLNGFTCIREDFGCPVASSKETGDVVQAVCVLHGGWQYNCACLEEEKQEKHCARTRSKRGWPIIASFILGLGACMHFMVLLCTSFVFWLILFSFLYTG